MSTQSRRVTTMNRSWREKSGLKAVPHRVIKAASALLASVGLAVALAKFVGLLAAALSVGLLLAIAGCIRFYLELKVGGGIATIRLYKSGLATVTEREGRPFQEKVGLRYHIGTGDKEDRVEEDRRTFALDGGMISHRTIKQSATGETSRSFRDGNKLESRSIVTRFGRLPASQGEPKRLDRPGRI